MAGCILLKDNSYNVADRQRHTAYVFVNGDVTSTAIELHRTVYHDRIGSGWMKYLEKFTDDGPRIRKIKIQHDKLRDDNDRCWGFE